MTMIPEGYISVTQFARKHGVCVDTVYRWICTNWLEGVIKVKNPNSSGFVYAVEQDAAPLPAHLAPKPASGRDYTPEEMVEYIRRNCVKQTYEQIRRELGISNREIRRIYDQLHEAYGI